MNDNIYTPRICINLIQRKPTNGVNTAVVIPYRDYEISIGMDDSCGAMENLGRSDLIIMKNGKNVTGDFFAGYTKGTIITATAAHLKIMMDAIDHHYRNKDSFFKTKIEIPNPDNQDLVIR
jgi:hypothetical protein